MDFINNSRSGCNQIQIIFPLQPFLDNFQMQQPQKTAAVTKPQSDGGFGLKLKGGVVKLQFFQRIPQIRIFRPVGRIHAAVHHGIHFFISGKRFVAGSLIIGNGIPHCRILYVFDGCGDIAYHSRGKLFAGNKLSGSEITDFNDFRNSTGSHHADRRSLFNRSLHNPAENNYAFIRIIQGIKNQSLQGVVRAASGSRYLIYNLFQHILDSHAVLSGNQRRVLRLDPDHILNLFNHTLRLGAGKVDLIDYRKNIQVMIQSQINVGKCLGFNSLGGVHHQYSAVAGRKAAAYFIIEIHMPRRIDQVKNVFLSVFRPVDGTYGLRLDGNASLPFQFHIVKHLRLHLPAGKKACFFYNPICQRRLAVIDMGHNTKITYPALICF